MRRYRREGPRQVEEFIPPTWKISLAQGKWLGRRVITQRGFDANGNRIEAEVEWLETEEKELIHTFFHKHDASEWIDHLKGDYPKIKIIENLGGKSVRTDFS